MAKEYDGDFAKMVNKTGKPRDEAQKWRAFKNFTRFFKNPFGYTFWKVATLSNQNRIRFIYVLMVFHLYQSFMLYLLTKSKKENMIANWRWHIGENNKHYSNPTSDRRFPAHRHKNYLRYSNFHQQLKNKRISMIHTNWWCRDQVFRKYFDIRKRNGMEPSMSGFYHEDVDAKTKAQNTEWARIRANKSML